MLSFIGKISRVSAAVFASLAFLFVTSVAHVGATPMPTHDMSSGMHSGMSKTKSPACAAVCSTATIKEEKEELLYSEEQDDEPSPLANQPYYALYGRFVIPKKLSSSYLENYPVLRPPDLVKLYSNYRF